MPAEVNIIRPSLTTEERDKISKKIHDELIDIYWSFIQDKERQAAEYTNEDFGKRCCNDSPHLNEVLT